MPGRVTAADQPLSSDLSLLSMNYEYLLSSCSELVDNAAVRERMGQIELDVAALYWELSREDRDRLAGQFRAFIEMKRTFRRSHAS
ncbi:MAG: hypothetical protein AAF720_13290 [Pseudomonadota bacterium]